MSELGLVPLGSVAQSTPTELTCKSDPEVVFKGSGELATDSSIARKLCYRKDDRAMR